MTWDEAISLLSPVSQAGLLAERNDSGAGLYRIKELLGLLGNPQRNLRFVHIAGTNGKGSAAAMLSAILQCAGYRTGRYISPHLIRINERFAVDGIDVTDTEFSETAAEIRAAAAGMKEKPRIFELFTAFAFLWFFKKQCEIVVLEVGLGGRLDATNVIDRPLCALIMNIGLEHTQQLGDTIEKIAFEKAGIIKPACDAVLYAQSSEADAVVRQVCIERGAKLVVTDRSLLSIKKLQDSADGPVLNGQTFSYRGRMDLRLSLSGTYQVKNAAAVLDVIDILTGRQGLRISEEAVRQGLLQVRWPGRFQILSQEPLLIIDGAHNPNGVQALASSMRSAFPDRPLIFLMGVMADKNYREMLDILAGVFDHGQVLHFLAVSPDEERSLSAELLLQEIKDRFSCPSETCADVHHGLKRSFELWYDAGDRGSVVRQTSPVILAFGSLYQVGEILSGIENAQNDA
ncbi:MAG: bifunctional folylpolyglutamate synthase/dihydrofolate synthase [Lachnospiraceae bacterium]|nr:bifunctional folylpolyglutamate synthase/dihydrofolate synthase [Lachnospiraceae bacterium]